MSLNYLCLPREMPWNVYYSIGAKYISLGPGPIYYSSDRLRVNPRQEPGALVPHAWSLDSGYFRKICAGGAGQPAFLSRPPAENILTRKKIYDRVKINVTMGRFHLIPHVKGRRSICGQSL
jgi:hypothetical protein